MMLGITMTVLNLVLNIVLIRGLGPIPAFGTTGAAMGTCIASGLVAVYALWQTVEWRVGHLDSARRWLWSRLVDHQIDLQVWSCRPASRESR